jgi:Domain of unknown function (DUF4326)
MTTLISLRTKGGKKSPPYDMRIDRCSQFGNPHKLGWCFLCKKLHDRDEAVEEFRKYFYKRLERDHTFKKCVLGLKDKILACWCKPLKCHGDIIIEYLDSL